MVVATAGVGAVTAATLPEYNPSLVAVGKRGRVGAGRRGQVATVPRGIPAGGGPCTGCPWPSSASCRKVKPYYRDLGSLIVYATTIYLLLLSHQDDTRPVVPKSFLVWVF